MKRRPDFECWPDLRLTLRPLPWAWKLKPSVWVDDYGIRAQLTVSWLFVTVEWWGQDKGPLFPMQDPVEHPQGAET